MSKALKTIGTIVVAVVAAAVIVTAVATGVGIPALLAAPSIIGGISVGGLLAIGAGISMAGSLLAPKAKAPGMPSAIATRDHVSINLRTPRTIVFGHTAMNTDLRDQEWSADQSHLHRFIVCASHKVQSIDEIWFDDKLAWTSGGGAQGEFVGYLTVTAILEGSAANAINISARMGSSRRYTGCGYVHFDYKLTGNTKKTDSPFAQSIPTRVTIIGKGAPVYDPRKDSTVGGSGSQRANDQTTWTWDDDASRNPVLQQLWYELGWRIQNPSTSAWKLAVGKGIPPARLNLASYIEAANLCDEAVAKAAGGTEPRYRSDGVFNEGDDPGTVRENLKAACNATLDDIDGKIRITVLHNDLASPAGDLGTADVIGAFTWTQTPPLDQSVNIIRGGYTDPSTTSLYQLADYPEVSYSSIDGLDRPQTVNLPLVQSPSQAQRLAKLRLQRAVFGGVFEATFQATAWRVQKGVVIRFTFAPLGWTNKLLRIADTAVQVDGTVPMVLREEDAAIYPATATDAAPVVGVNPTTYDPTQSVLITAIDDAADDAILSAGSEKQQAIIDWGAVNDDFSALAAKYADLGSPADLASVRSAATTAIGDLAAYLEGLTPDWDDGTTDTAIVPAAWKAKWSGAYTAVSAFAAAISGRPGLKPRGAYESATTYFVNDVVRYNGGSYEALQDNFSGHAPSGTGSANAYWDVLSAPGAEGAPATPPSAFSATIPLSSGSAVNLYDQAVANGYTGHSDATVTFTVPNGVTIRGLASGIGIDSGSWPSGYTLALTLTILSGGIVDGGGGDGGPGGSPGADGGDAILLRTSFSGGITINSGGIVRGGGGGGGGRNTTGTGGKFGGGGGGGGAPNGAGGDGGSGWTGDGSPGSAGGTSGGGAGGSPGGGAGGTFATAGTAASDATAGGAAGYAVRKNGNTATVTNSGTMTGTAA